MNNIYKFTVDRFEENNAVLANGETKIILLKSLLPKGVKEGDCVVVTIETEEKNRKIRTKKAKDILNEIFGKTKSQMDPPSYH